jgi:hypothetical protein
MWVLCLASDSILTIGLHIPTFLRSCEDLWALPVENVVYEISLPFLALYLVVCTVSMITRFLSHLTGQLGLQFMDTKECSKHFTPEEAHTLPDLWYNSARSVRHRPSSNGTDVRHCTERTLWRTTPWRRFSVSC